MELQSLDILPANSRRSLGLRSLNCGLQSHTVVVKNLATEKGFYSSMTKTELKNECVVDPSAGDPRRLRQYSPVWWLTASPQPWFQTHSTHPLHWAAPNTLAQIWDYSLLWILTYLIYAFIKTWVHYRKQRILTLPTIILPQGSIHLISIPLD